MGTLSYSHTIQNETKIKAAPVNDNFSKAIAVINGEIDENNIKNTTNLNVTKIDLSVSMTASLIESSGDIVLNSTEDDFKIYDDLMTTIFDIYSTVGTSITGEYQDSPIGTVEYYKGTWVNNTTKKGWYKCDGNNGTPDMRDLFVRGNTSSGGTGGNDDAVLVQHNHQAPASEISASHSHTASGNVDTDSMAHIHDITLYTSGPGAYYSAFSRQSTTSDYTGSYNDIHDHSVSNIGLEYNSVVHTHTLSINNTGSSGTGANKPAYYTLVPIIRVS